MPKRVLVVGSGADSNVLHVADAVARRKGEVTFLDTDLVPEQATLSLRDGVPLFAGEALEDIRCAYVKSVRLALPGVHPDAPVSRAFESWQERYVAERERHAFVLSFLRAFGLRKGRTVVNPVDAFDQHLLKPYQLELLRRHKIPVPASLATCDPAEVRAFAEAHSSVIYKPLAGGAHARRLLPEDLTTERLALLTYCPALFQEEIVGEEFRAYVLGFEPLRAFKIPTAPSPTDPSMIDARQWVHLAKPAKLPESIWSICCKAARATGLLFTAVDLRRTRDGRVAVLELNPTPAVAFYEDPKRGPILRALADFLVAHA